MWSRGGAAALLVLLVGAPLAGGCGALSSNDGAGFSSPWDAQSPDGAMTGLPADGNACTPSSSVETFLPSGSYRFANPVSGACTADQIKKYYDACFGASSSPATCALFSQASINATCSSCILTSSSATAYGPLVKTGSLVLGNVAGCIELTEPSLLACAESTQARAACEVAGCAANCPVTENEPSTLAAYNACAAAVDADMKACGLSRFPATCLSVTDADAGPYTACLTTTFADFYDYAVPVFCGPNALPPTPEDDAGFGDDGSSEALDGGVADAELLDAASDGSLDGSPSSAHDATSDASGDASAATDASRSFDGAADATLAADAGGDEDAFAPGRADAEGADVVTEAASDY